MSRSILSRLAPVAVLASAAFVQNALAFTQPVQFNVLNASATLSHVFVGGDNLRLDTLVTTETGALLQTINFKVGPGVGSFEGEAAWEISTANGTGPRLIGVNIDLFDAANNLIASDTFAGVLAGFAHSTLGGALGPGSYKLVATGTGVRDSSLDVTLSFINAVPEPETYGLMLAGLGVIGFIARRRRG